MESATAIAIVLKPIVLPVFYFVVVAPIAWALYRMFPTGRLKVFLFRERGGPHATRQDKWVMGVAALSAYAGMFAALMVFGGV